MITKTSIWLELGLFNRARLISPKTIRKGRISQALLELLQKRMRISWSTQLETSFFKVPSPQRKGSTRGMAASTSSPTRAWSQI